MKKLKIYVATSWKNPLQEQVVDFLRVFYEVYDFKNPTPDKPGFGWHQVDPNWRHWNSKGFLLALSHPISEQAFKNDFDAMQWADVCVLLLPCGRSAHTEAGWFSGAGKPVIAVLDSKGNNEPELMYKMFTAVVNNMLELTDELHKLLSK